MGMRKDPILFVLLALTTQLSFATPEEMYKRLGTSAGSVKVLSETSDNCADGPFKIVGDPGEEVLMIGPKISLPLPNKDNAIVSTTDSHQCKEDVQGQFIKERLHVLTTVHSCPAKLKRLESRVEEIISVKDQTIKYQRLAKNEFRIECVFQWSKEVDKK